MTQQMKVQLSNLLMLAGSLPFLFALYSAFILAPSRRASLGIESDGFLTVGMLLITYAAAVVLIGSGLAWSRALSKRDGGAASSCTKALRALSCLVLCAPGLWFIIPLVDG